MNQTLTMLTLCLLLACQGRAAEAAIQSLIEGFKLVEVASVADAMEQLYGQRAYMSHDMRPVFTTKFAGPAITVQLKKEEHKDGAPASQGMLDAIDAAPAGSVYVMVVPDGADIAGMAVHIAARVAALAGPSEVLVSSTVREIVTGSRRAFGERGEHELKGVPGRWRVYSLASDQASIRP